MIRQPAVANQFYDGNASRLTRQLSQFIVPSRGARSAIAVIAPHAGYIYSGAVAGAAYAEVKVPETAIILGVNHTGIGAPASLMGSGLWNMPMGEVEIKEELASIILKKSEYIENDPSAHLYEHSLEVQVPFLQFLRPDISIVPICLGYMPYAHCASIGVSLAEAVKEYKKEVLIVASTDMTHYESQRSAEAKDRLAIDKIQKMDPEGLYNTVKDHGISMCGVIPTTITLVASRALGAKTAKLIRYATSGDVSGDYYQVVGYASFVVE
jgi:AmmeMemoRadiSam system protein B